MATLDSHDMDWLLVSYSSNTSPLIGATTFQFSGSDLSIIQSVRFGESNVSATAVPSAVSSLTTNTQAVSTTPLSNQPPSSPGSSPSLTAASRTRTTLQTSAVTFIGSVSPTSTSPFSSHSSPPSNPVSTPICSIHQNPNGGDGGASACSADTYCDCSSGSVSGQFATMNATGADICAWNTLPTQTWAGSACGTPSPTPPPPSGQYIFTSTRGPVSGDENTVLYGCTATTTTVNAITLCAGAPTPISTIVPPLPKAGCDFEDGAVMWKVQVKNITNWAEKGGASWSSTLHDRVQDNCGAITRWKTRNDTGGDFAYFDIPFVVISDIEKSITEAGGPKHVDCR